MKTILISVVFFFITMMAYSQTTYTFNGNGNWSDSANWLNRLPPPQTLSAGNNILINPADNGTCVLDIAQFISAAGTVTVAPGKTFILNENLTIDPEKGFLALDESNPDSLAKVPIFDTSSLFAHRSATILSLPETYELYMPRPGNQGAQGSCAVWAAAYATRSYHLSKDECNTPYGSPQDNSRIFSPAFIFNELKYPLSACGTGTNLFDVLSKMKSAGTATWHKMPYSTSEQDCAIQPNNEQRINAAFFRIDDFNRIYDISENNIKKIISLGFPIMIGVRVDALFWTDGKFTWSSDRAKYVGNHAMVICGWDNNRQAYKIINSWNTSWGYGGFGWIGYEYLKEVMLGSGIGSYGSWDAFVMKTAPTKYQPDFSLTSGSIDKGESITFTDKTEPKPAAIQWAFPGGSPAISTEPTVTVNYINPGVYKAYLTINPTCAATTKTKEASINVIETGSTFIDSRDQQVYTYKQIGTQMWMTQNLNYAAPGSRCYDDSTENCAIYGRLYDWNTAITAAPPGWHVPSRSEWFQLCDFLGGEEVAGGALKSTTGWKPFSNGATNSSGFSALPGGAYSEGNPFGSIGYYGFWWSATENMSNNTEALNISLYYQGTVFSSTGNFKINHFSVRCIRD